MSNLTLDTPISALNRVGQAIAARLKKMDIATVADLLWHVPFRYSDYSKIVTVSQIEPGVPVTIKGKIELIKSRRSFRRRMFVTEALVSDATGSVKVVWFNQPYLTKSLPPGTEIFLSGEPDIAFPELQFTNPVHERALGPNIHTGRIVPMYALTQGITHKQLRFLISQVIILADSFPEYLPAEMLKRHQLESRAWAIQKIHFPASLDEAFQAQRRLKFDELFDLQLKVACSKKLLRELKAQPLRFYEDAIRAFVLSLPFQLTDDQKKSAWQIIQDTGVSQPMNRLLEGDVGSGKTVVAAMALLNCALNREQAVLMAPTEILAIQHYNKIFEWFKDLKITVGLLTRSRVRLNGADVTKRHLAKAIEAGQVEIVIGTHALIAEKMTYPKLALAIIDEQHRFGVEQRRALSRSSGRPDQTPHILTMTATPIPRTLALALYGDLSLSVIRAMPTGRKKIITEVVYASVRDRAYSFIRQRLAAGEQGFVICPLVDPSDKLGAKSVTEEYERLRTGVFKDTAIAAIHGQLTANQKEAIMQRFKDAEIRLLVATSIVEVGVDVPNATIMIIESAERFGLSQLHQFRGRIGRSDKQSYCFLFPATQTPISRRRLDAFLRARDSLELAQYDLDLRGPGQLYGSEQSGFAELRWADAGDVELIQAAQTCAAEALQLPLQNYPLLKERIEACALSLRRD